LLSLNKAKSLTRQQADKETKNMSKMQRIWLNLFLILIGYVGPIIALRANSNNYQNIYVIQLIVLLVILAMGIFLTYINNKNRKKYIEARGYFIIFEIAGVLGIMYSVLLLYLIFAFRQGIGF
jgi:uncharacterized membrane protein